MDSDLADVLKAVAAVLAALALVITAVSTLRTGYKVDAVHVLVNQQHTDLVAYQDDLVKTLRSAGVKVPADKSIAAAERAVP